MGKKHQEVVDLFRAITDTCTLSIEKHAERRILNVNIMLNFCLLLVFYFCFVKFKKNL